MRKATKKEEIAIIEHCMLCTNNKVKLRTMILQTLNRKQLVSARIRKFANARHPEVWQWKEFLVSLQLGWRRYFYACNHKDSIFCRIYFHEKKVTKGCECCLYWRGIAAGFLLAIILSSLFNLGKFLL